MSRSLRTWWNNGLSRLGFSRTRCPAAKRRPTRRLMAEPLEQRQLLSMSPYIAYMYPSQYSVTHGDTFTLTAGGVWDDGAIQNVAFYQDGNSNGAVDYGDTPLGYGTQDWSGSYSLSINTGNYNFSGSTCFVAQATDDELQTSNVVSTSVNVNVNAPPTIGSFSASPDPVVAGQSLTLSASGVYAGSGSLYGVTFSRTTMPMAKSPG